MRTTRTTDLPAIFLLIIMLSAAPGLAHPDEDEEPATDVTDSSTDRLPATTTFPKYPPMAQRDRIEGEATVCFRIAPDGGILDAEIDSSTHRIFEKPVLRAIEQSSFEPLAPGEELSGARTCRTYRFRLEPVTVLDEPESSAPIPASFPT